MKILRSKSYINEPRPVVLNQGHLAHLGELDNCLEAFLVITIGRVATGIQWVERGQRCH